MGGCRARGGRTGMDGNLENQFHESQAAQLPLDDSIRLPQRSGLHPGRSSQSARDKLPPTTDCRERHHSIAMVNERGQDATTRKALRSIGASRCSIIQSSVFNTSA